MADITLLEPAVALEKNGAYAVIAKADDRLIFPHVDSCFAMVGLIEGGGMLGGHVPQQWPGSPKDLVFCFNKMLSLLEANRKRLGDKPITLAITIGPSDWLECRGDLWSKWGVGAALAIATNAAVSGVDAVVTAAKVEITSCKSKKVTTFDVKDDEFQTLTFSD